MPLSRGWRLSCLVAVGSVLGVVGGVGGPLD